MSENTTVFMAEIEAIKRSVEYVINSNLLPDMKFLKIYVDSQAALLALNSVEIGSTQVKETIISLNQLGSMAKVTMVWTKAHIGTIGNERADELAKAGTSLGEINIRIPLPLSYIKGRIKEKMREIWAQEWVEYPHGWQTKQLCMTPSTNMTKKLMEMSRHDVGRLVRLVSGHNTLNYHMSLMTPGSSDRCRFCRESRETFYHFIKECPRLREHRAKIFQN